MGIRSAFSPFGGRKSPYKKNQVLLDLRHENPETIAIDTVGSLKIYKGRYLLELVSGGAAGAGWQDGHVWSGGGSGSAIKVEIALPAGIYDYCCGAAANGSGKWYCGGTGRDSYFKTANNENLLNFYLVGGYGEFGKSSCPGGTIRNYSSEYVLTQYLKSNGNAASGHSNQPGANFSGAPSVYITENIEWGKGANSMGNRGMQGFLRLTYLGN